MNTEPTEGEYARYFELLERDQCCDEESDLTTVEEQEFERLESLVSPWMYTINVHELALENHGLIAVPETLMGGCSYTRWISAHFAVIPLHRQRDIDRETRFLWAILPFDEQPVESCSLVFEDGRFRRDKPELLNWEFDVWIYRSIQARGAYKQHFGSEFITRHGNTMEEINKWIGQLNI